MYSTYCMLLYESCSYFQEGNIEQVRIGIKAKLPTPELAQLLMSLLEQLVNDCRFVTCIDHLSTY